MKATLAAVLSLSLFVLAGCPAGDRTGEATANTQATADDEAALEQLARQYEQAVRAGDQQALTRLHTGDAWMSLGTGPTGSPAEAITDVAADLTIETRRTQVVGDWAYASGSWRQQVTGADGVQRQLDGHYLTVFRRENNEWRIRDVVSNLSEQSRQAMTQMQQPAPVQ